MTLYIAISGQKRLSFLDKKGIGFMVKILKGNSRSSSF